MQPAAYRIQARPADPTSVAGGSGDPQPTVVPWPADAGSAPGRCGHLRVGSGEALAAALTRGEHADVLHRGRRHVPGEQRSRPASRRLLLRARTTVPQWASPTRSTSRSPRSSATAPGHHAGVGRRAGGRQARLLDLVGVGQGQAAEEQPEGHRAAVQRAAARSPRARRRPTARRSTATCGPEVDEIQPKIKAKYGVMVSITKLFNKIGAFVKRKSSPTATPAWSSPSAERRASSAGAGGCTGWRRRR